MMTNGKEKLESVRKYLTAVLDDVRGLLADMDISESIIIVKGSTSEYYVYSVPKNNPLEVH
jgi:hypothetical protein